jgi:hypothetical protein
MAKDEQPRDLMDYEAMQVEALRGVIRLALLRATAPEGLPGDHHFYISFRTGAAHVAIPEDLRERYPDEMTIVLQNQFWDLNPGEAAFSVTLQFNGRPKSLSIPYAAITRFYDPSVQYLLQFSAPPVQAPPAPAKAPLRALAPTDKPPGEDAGGERNVVSLDLFRKK